MSHAVPVRLGQRLVHPAHSCHPPPALAQPSLPCGCCRHERNIAILVAPANSSSVGSISHARVGAHRTRMDESTRGSGGQTDGGGAAAVAGSGSTAPHCTCHSSASARDCGSMRVLHGSQLILSPSLHRCHCCSVTLCLPTLGVCHSVRLLSTGCPLSTSKARFQPSSSALSFETGRMTKHT